MRYLKSFESIDSLKCYSEITIHEWFDIIKNKLSSSIDKFINFSKLDILKNNISYDCSLKYILDSHWLETEITKCVINTPTNIIHIYETSDEWFFVEFVNRPSTDFIRFTPVSASMDRIKSEIYKCDQIECLLSLLKDKNIIS